jgi:hypothetical protein
MAKNTIKKAGKKPAKDTIKKDSKNLIKKASKNVIKKAGKNTSRKRGYACKHADYLKILHKCKKSDRPHLIVECDQEKVLAICECADNILRGKIPLTSRQKQRLKEHVEVLKNLADTTINWKKKQNYLATQEGGAILSTILGIAIPALISYLASR